MDMQRVFSLMEKQGGGFASSLAVAWRRADLQNKRIIEDAFKHLVAEYEKRVNLLDAPE